MIDVKGIEKHIEQLSGKSDILSLKIDKLEEERDEIESKIKELNKQLLEARRSTIEYHKGDLLLTYNDNFYWHDDICTVYELLEEVKAESADTRVKVMKIYLHDCDGDILTRITRDSYQDIVDFEQNKDVYYLKSSALSDLLMTFHDLSVTGEPDGSNEYVNKYIFGKIKEVIDKYDGKKLVDVIEATKKFKENTK